VPKKNPSITIWLNPRKRKVEKILDDKIWLGKEAETANFFLSLKAKEGESGIFFSSEKERGMSLEVQEKIQKDTAERKIT
jgi:hypothetical protein